MNRFSIGLPILLFLIFLFGYIGITDDSIASKDNGITLSKTSSIDANLCIKSPCRRESQEIPGGASALIEAYPDFIKGYANNHIIFTDGSEMVYDDGEEKDFIGRLDNSDLEDMFFTRYEDGIKAPEYLSDAGRSRCDRLFKKMYGSSAAEVQSNLVKINWFGSEITFSKINNASKNLQSVASELALYSDMQKYLKCSGTTYWRKVRGANRMSAHSYGIAIDIGVDFSDYWLWKNPNAKETDSIPYSNRIPRLIIDIFRKYGFIWGGAWYHFDTMHFEYRPEIICFSEQE